MKGLPVARCRPRIEGERERQILDATTALLVETGYDRLTLDAVAAAAHVSKATLYRRWPGGKAELVVEAVSRGEVGPVRSVDTGSLRGDLLELSCGGRGWVHGPPIGVLSAVACAMQRDSDLFTAIRARFVEPLRQASIGVFHRAQQRGEIAGDADLDLLSRVLPALAMHQVYLLHEPLTDERIAYLVDTVVLPVCRVAPAPQVATTGGR